MKSLLTAILFLLAAFFIWQYNESKSSKIALIKEKEDAELKHVENFIRANSGPSR